MILSYKHWFSLWLSWSYTILAFFLLARHIVGYGKYISIEYTLTHIQILLYSIFTINFLHILFYYYLFTILFIHHNKVDLLFILPYNKVLGFVFYVYFWIDFFSISTSLVFLLYLVVYNFAWWLFYVYLKFSNSIN